MQNVRTIMIGLLWLVAGGDATAASPSTKIDLPIEQWRLGNGLRVFFVRHTRVPAVSVQVWYHAGSKDERPGARGVAHMFEHMMFKGSRRVRPEAHARMISSVGGSVNAFTTQDVTAYHNTLPKQYLDFAMRLEAERMRNLLLTDKTIKSEREVVKEEKRARLDNNPIGRAIEAIHALAYTKHPYAWTPAGVIADLDRIGKRDCQSFYDTYYVPSNALLIVVGDVTEARVRSAARKHFGAIPTRPEPARVTDREPPQQAMRRKVASWPSQLNLLLGAFVVPPASHPDLAALRIATTVLSTGRSSRLYRSLVRTNKAVDAGASLSPREHAGLLIIYARGSGDIAEMERVLLAEATGLARRGPTRKELQRARNQLATAHLQRLQTSWGIAYQIGSSALLRGDPRAFVEDVERIDSVSAEDVKRVATKYLKRQGLSLIQLPATAAKKEQP